MVNVIRQVLHENEIEKGVNEKCEIAVFLLINSQMNYPIRSCGNDNSMSGPTQHYYHYFYWSYLLQSAYDTAECDT